MYFSSFQLIFAGIYHSEKASKYADLIITDENQALSLKNRLLMGIFRKKYSALLCILSSVQNNFLACFTIHFNTFPMHW